MTGPDTLRVEHLDEPLGLGQRRPRLSWRLPPGTTAQRAYRIRLKPDEDKDEDKDEDTGTDTGWRDSPDSVLVPWPFPPLASRQRVSWQVTVRTDRRRIRLVGSRRLRDRPARPGRLDRDLDRPGRTGAATHSRERPAYELRHVITLPKPAARARLYATAHGLYEAFLNGTRIGDLELTPGFTQYASRLNVQAYDVTGLVAGGRERAHRGAQPTAGSAARSASPAPATSGATGPRFLAQLHVEHPDGTTSAAGTDRSWQSRPSHITSRRPHRRPVRGPPPDRPAGNRAEAQARHSTAQQAQPGQPRLRAP